MSAVEPFELDNLENFLGSEILGENAQGSGIVGGIVSVFKQIGIILFQAVQWFMNATRQLLLWTASNPQDASILFGTLAILYS
jgi:hypothetical protein